MDTTKHLFTALRLLPDNGTAWQAKRHLVAGATRTLDLSYFIVEADATTSRLMLDLAAAAARGVQVRLLVDYFTTFKQAPLLRLLGSIPQVQVRRYGVPSPLWLAALDAAGIDSGAFVRGLMAADAAAVLASLKGSGLAHAAEADHADHLHDRPDSADGSFTAQVLGFMERSLAALAKGGGGPARVVAAMAHAWAIVGGFKQFLHRSHHKLLLADGAWFVMGGRNLADAYHAATSADGHHFQDTDLLARDRSAGGSAHASAFEALWNSARVADIRTPDPLDQRAAMTLDQLQELAAAAPPVPADAFAGGIALPDMDGLLVNNLPGDHGDTAITRAYSDRIRRLIAARRPAVVDIVSAYLFLGDDPATSATLAELRQALLDAVAADITVNIHTNSLESTDLKPVNRAAYGKLLPLIQAGVRIHELAPGQGSLHTKSAAIGDHCLMVGSYNMDPRSELFDTNNLIVLEDTSGVGTAAFRQSRVAALQWNLLTADVVAQWVRHRPEAIERVTNPIL